MNGMKGWMSSKLVDEEHVCSWGMLQYNKVALFILRHEGLGETCCDSQKTTV